jgi:methylglyoxal synthase
MPYRIAMIASRSHRRGPDSRLLRLVREFEHFLVHQEIWAIKGAHAAISRAGLLQGALREVPAGRAGGIVEITHKVVTDQLDVVIHLMDPRDPTSIYPEATALKRECIAKGKLFLSTYMSAVEWMSLVWQDSDGYMLRDNECKAADPATERIALIAHDRLKVRMLRFALLDHRGLLTKFREIIATGTTGRYLQDPSRSGLINA